MTFLPFQSRRAERAGKVEDHCRPASGTRDTAAASTKFQHVERGAFRAICNGEGFHVRATGIAVFQSCTKSSRPQVLWPAHPFQSAHVPSGADTGGLSFLLPARLRFKFSRLLKAPGSLIRLSCSIALQAGKQTARCCSKALHLNLSALSKGLVDVADGHSNIERKSENVRQGGEKIHV